MVLKGREKKLYHLHSLNDQIYFPSKQKHPIKNMDSVDRHRFDPLSLRNVKKSPEENIFFKGGDMDGELELDLEDIEIKISKLRSVAGEAIVSLESPYDSYFEEVKHIVYLLRNNEAYSELHKIAKKYFSDVTEVYPGTVSAYFIGCEMLKKDKNNEGSCNILCAKDYMRSQDQAWSFCDTTVVHALYSEGDDHYGFIPINIVENGSKLIICIKDKTYTEFSGFSEDEKDFLKNKYNADILNMVSYDSKGGYIDLIGGAVRLSDIKTRKLGEREKTTIQEKDAGSVAFVTILLVVVVMFILLFMASRR